MKVKEWSPKEYAEYNASNDEEKEQSAGWGTLLKNAPVAFWQVGLVQFFCWGAFLYMWNYTTGTIGETVWGTTDVTSEGYQAAGNWTGIVFGVQTLGAVLWAAVLPRFKNMKVAYAVSLVIGAIGFAMVPCIHYDIMLPVLDTATGVSFDFAIKAQYLLFLPFLLIGCAWAAMLSMPFALVTNALQGYGHMGAYLGLFNCTICIPQIVAALLGGVILTLVGSHQYSMMFVAGALLVIGALCVFIIRDKQK